MTAALLCLWRVRGWLNTQDGSRWRRLGCRWNRNSQPLLLSNHRLSPIQWLPSLINSSIALSLFKTTMPWVRQIRFLLAMFRSGAVPINPFSKERDNGKDPRDWCCPRVRMMKRSNCCPRARMMRRRMLLLALICPTESSASIRALALVLVTQSRHSVVQYSFPLAHQEPRIVECISQTKCLLWSMYWGHSFTALTL